MIKRDGLIVDLGSWLAMAFATFVVVKVLVPILFKVTHNAGLDSLQLIRKFPVNLCLSLGAFLAPHQL